MSSTSRDPPGEHTHEVSVTKEQFLQMYDLGEVIQVVTMVAHNHAHTLSLRYVHSQDRSVMAGEGGGGQFLKG